MRAVRIQLRPRSYRLSSFSQSFIQSSRNDTCESTLPSGKRVLNAPAVIMSTEAEPSSEASNPEQPELTDPTTPTVLRTEEVEQQASDNVEALTEEINSLRQRISELDHQLAATEQENVQSQTQYANLSATLTQVQRELAELVASSKFIAAAKEAVDKELAIERERRETAEETVEVLRGKVDDARKAFGTLQKGDKRASTLIVGAPDPPALDALGISSMDDPPSVRTNKGKRTSMHFGRRLSNASDQEHPGSANLLLSPPQMGSVLTTPVLPQAPVNSKGLRELRLASGGTSAWTAGGMPLSPNAERLEVIPDLTTAPKRWSGLGFGGGTAKSPAKPTPAKDDAVEELDDVAELPRPAPPSHRISTSSIASAPGANVDLTGSPGKKADDRFDSLYAEIIQLRSQLTESQEARAASEECLKALREFIASGPGEDADAPGIEGIKLPPLPTDRDPEEDLAAQSSQADKKSAGGWGLGLWRSSAAPNIPVGTQSISTSTRSEAPTSAAQSPALSSVQLPDAQSVAKGVPAGTPKIETPPAAVIGSSKKGFSVFTRSTSEKDVTATDEGAPGPKMI